MKNRGSRVDFKDLTRLIVKVFGALVLVDALTLLPDQTSRAMELYEGWQTVMTHVVWPFVFPAVAGCAMLFWPGAISNRLIRGDSLSTSPEAYARIQHIALCVLGVYLLFNAIGELGFVIGQMVSLKLLFANVRAPAIVGVMHNELYGALVGGVAQFIASIALLFWSKPIGQWLTGRQTQAQSADSSQRAS